MRIQYSPDEGLLYVVLREGAVVETVELEEGVVADLGADGEPVGVEFLDAGAFFPFLARRAPAGGGVVAVDLPHGLAALATSARPLAP